METTELPIAKPQLLSERFTSLNAMWEKGEITAFYTSMSNLLQETIFEKLGLPIEEQDKITVVNLLNRVIKIGRASCRERV